MKKLLSLVILASAVVLTSTANAVADDMICPGPLPAVIDNVIVTGGICFLIGTVVNGDVKVEPTGILVVAPGSVRRSR